MVDQPETINVEQNIRDIDGEDVRVYGIYKEYNYYNDYYNSNHPALSFEERRIRQSMLDKVSAIWIDGVLASRNQRGKIEPSFVHNPAAVKNAFGVRWDGHGHTDETMRRSKHVTEEFHRLKRNMLILGATGSGKSTMLLRLAKHLLEEANTDQTRVIPVIFNLSPWSEKQPDFADWLVEELAIRYQVSHEQGRVWVERQDLLLLLNGLDEMALAVQEKCVDAINAFRQTHGATDMVVVGRIEDHKQHTVRLQLNGALVVQPLNDEQVDSYLLGTREDVTPIVHVLQQDEELRQLARTPLMLNILVMAFQGQGEVELPEFDSLEARRHYLFEQYVNRRFELIDPERELYSRAKTERYLSWIATTMNQHACPEFLIERLQPGWLPDPHCWMYRRRAGVIGSLIFGGVVGFAAALAGGLVIGLLLGVAVTLALTYAASLMTEIEIHPVEAMHWSWAAFRRVARKHLPRATAVGLVGGLVLGGLFGASGELAKGIFLGVELGLSFGLAIGLAVSVVDALVANRVHPTNHPNQGIRQSASNALKAILSTAFVVTLAFSGTVILTGHTANAISMDLSVPVMDSVTTSIGGGMFGYVLVVVMVGLAGGLALAVEKGGDAVFAHVVLRDFLHRHGYAPKNYADFLDYAAEVRLLVRVGGGYMFIHRYLQDYYAALWQPDESEH